MVRRKKKVIIALFITAALFAGCGVKDNTVTDEAEENPHIEENGSGIEGEGASAEKEETEDQRIGELNQGSVEVTGTAVGIYAHVKEIYEDKILISSDSNDFPGAFNVEVPENVFNISELSGGTYIQILMQDKDEKDASGIREFLAKSIVIWDRQEKVEQSGEDILLTDAPVFTLSDILSSLYSSIEIYSGNYSWNYMIDGEMMGMVACGAAPLDEMGQAELELPDYRNMDVTYYSFSTLVTPDQLIVRKWDAEEIGNYDAEEISIITYYYQSPLLALEAGKVYEFTAVWKEENLESQGFYGEASYVLVTK